MVIFGLILIFYEFKVLFFFVFEVEKLNLLLVNNWIILLFKKK